MNFASAQEQLFTSIRLEKDVLFLTLSQVYSGRDEDGN